MSHKATNWAYAQNLGKCGAKFVLVALADYADEAHSCYPGQEKLAAMTDQSVESVRRHLKGLEADGYIKRSRRFTSDGYRTSDRYELNVDGQLDNRDPDRVDLPVKSPTGQNDRRSNRRTLPANLTGPTGQSEGVSVREPSENHEEGQTTLLPAPEGSTSKRSRRAPERPIPEDWKPKHNHESYAREHGLDLSTESMKFRTHAAANDRRLRNWDAGFTQWLLRAREYAVARVPSASAWDGVDRVGAGW